MSMIQNTDFPPMAELVAHRGDMLLIDRVLAADGTWIKVAAHADPQAWYAQADGAMPAWLGIELMAQAIAAWAGLQGWRLGQPAKKGFLLGTRNYISRQPAFAPGSELEITASETFREDNGLAAFDCTLAMAGETLAEAALKVFEPNDFEAFMEQQT
jgi:predicted hotdog family 3-hydroxylacyl-ACP dehydratase